MQSRSRRPDVSAAAAFIGLDWSDEHHDLSLWDPASGDVERFQITHTPEALADFFGTTLRQRFGGRPVAIALEQSRGALIHALLGYEHLVLSASLGYASLRSG